MYLETVCSYLLDKTLLPSSEVTQLLTDGGSEFLRELSAAS